MGACIRVVWGGQGSSEVKAELPWTKNCMEQMKDGLVDKFIERYIDE